MQNTPVYMDATRNSFKYPQLTPRLTIKSNM